MNKLSFTYIVLLILCGLSCYAQNDLFGGFSTGKASLNNAQTTQPVQAKKQGSSNYSPNSTSVPNPNSPSEFTYYYAANNNQTVMIRGGFTEKQKAQYNPNTMSMHVNTEKQRFFHISHGGTGAGGICYAPIIEGNYWHLTYKILMTTYHYYVKTDFSEVKHENTVYNRRISKAEYDKYSRAIADFVNSNGSGSGVGSVPVNNNSNPNRTNGGNKSNGKIKCNNCNNGICPRCKGTGNVKESLSLEIVTCGGCGGSGKCKICYGRGFYY